MQYCTEYHIVLNCNITAPGCIWKQKAVMKMDEMDQLSYSQ